MKKNRKGMKAFRKEPILRDYDQGTQLEVTLDSMLQHES